ncbi:MAG: glycine cleavage system protein H [Anaerolineae bacterium]
MKIDKYDFPDELRYDVTHNWARVEGDEMVQGMTVFGAKLAGEIIYVEPAAVGRRVKQGQPLLSVESGKWVGRVNATVGGEVVAFNQDLEWHPDSVNKDPYGKGWMVRIRPDDLTADLARLRQASDPEYRALIESERRKYSL